MKILIINNLYPPNSRGGAETAVVNEAQSLRDLGHEVSVLTTASFQGLRSLGAHEWKEDDIRVFRFFPLNFFWYRNDYKHNAFVRVLWYAGVLWGRHQTWVLKKVVKIVKPDVIHLHNINGISYRYPRFCDKLKIPTIFTVHAVHYAVPSGVIIRGQEPLKIFKLFAALLRRRLHSQAIVTSPSQWLLDFYTGRGYFKGQQTAVIPNSLGSKIPDFNNQITKTTQKSETQNHKPIIRFLYVGQMEQYKGVNALLAAAKIVPDNYDFEINLVGTGSLEPELRKIRDRHIRFRGRLEGTELGAAFASADILLMPTLCEDNSPMVIAEAQSYGMPVIASVSGGIPEMVEHNVNGMLVAPGNANEIALQMRRCMDCPEILPPMREAAFKSAKRYKPDLVAGEYLKLFRK